MGNRAEQKLQDGFCSASVDLPGHLYRDGIISMTEGVSLFGKKYKHQYDIKQDGINGMWQNDISADQTRYSIILLEGNEPSVEIVRAVYQVSQQNLLKARELIVNAPQVIFEGDALEVRDKIQILDAGFVEYRIEPDYPYAESV